jgi:uncharacterized protein
LEKKLRIKREEIQEGGMELHMDLPPSWFSSMYAEQHEVRIDVPISIDFMVYRLKDKIRVRGAIHTKISLICSRCLEYFEFPISPNIDLTFSPRPKLPLPKEMELTKDDFEEEFYDGEEVDLSNPICEEIFLSIPMKPLCNENCLGLCAKCGANLNIDKCSCCNGAKDPRFMVLKEFNINRFKGV